MDVKKPTQGALPTNVAIPKGTRVDIESQQDFTRFQFPSTINASAKYLIYLHGKIIEDQGIPAVSFEFGEYEYLEILEKLESFGFKVISEVRAKNTDGVAYAEKVSKQVNTLLDAGVQPQNITIVGASKGGGIAIYASHQINNPEIRYVIMAICNPEENADLIQSGISLTGNVLSIYDSEDTFAGSCRELFEYSEGKGLSGSKEIILNVGSGHGILYKPLEEWILPVVTWANSR